MQLSAYPALFSAVSLKRIEPAQITGAAPCFPRCRRNLYRSTLCMEHGFEEPETFDQPVPQQLAQISAEPRVMSSCIGDVMNTEQSQKPLDKAGAWSIRPLQRPASRVIEGPQYEEPTRGPEEWQNLLNSLQQWVCELLIKNQELRMALQAVATQETEKRNGYSN